MEFNQSRITLARAMLTPILDWIITEGRSDCKVVSPGVKSQSCLIRYRCPCLSCPRHRANGRAGRAHTRHPLHCQSPFGRLKVSSDFPKSQLFLRFPPRTSVYLRVTAFGCGCATLRFTHYGLFQHPIAGTIRPFFTSGAVAEWQTQRT
jgi:hypothetical protein